jgi:hypothetical protein
LCLSFSCLYVVFLSSSFILRWIIDTPQIKKEITRRIEQKTDVRVSPSQIQISLFPKIVLKINHTQVNLTDDLKIDIGSIIIFPEARPLLTGEFLVSKITLENPNIIFTPGNSKKKKDDPKKENQLFSFNWSFLKINHPLALLPLCQQEFEFDIKNGRSPYSQQMDGHFFVSKEKRLARFNAVVRGFRLENNPNIALFPSGIEIKTIESDKLDLKLELASNAVVKGSLYIEGLTIFSSKNSERPLVTQSLKTNFVFSQDRIKADISPFKLDYPTGTISLEFSSESVLNRSKLYFNGESINIGKARKLTLSTLSSIDTCRDLFDILRAGNAKDITVFFQLDKLEHIFDNQNFSLSGNVEKGSVKIPETNLFAKNIYGSAAIKKGILNIKTRQGKIGTSSFKKGRLDVDLFNYPDFPFHGDFNLDVDLATLPDKLISLLPDTLLSKELSLVTNLTDHAKARLTLSLDTMQENMNIRVHATEFSAHGNYSRIPGDIDVFETHFDYETDKVTLTGFSGQADKSKITDLNAVFDFTSDKLLQIQSGSALLNIDTLMPWLKTYDRVMKIISLVKDGRGDLVINSIAIEGDLLSPEKWEYDIRGTGNNLLINLGTSLQDITSMSCSFSFSDKGILLSKIKADLPNWNGSPLSLKKDILKLCSYL